MKTIYKHKTGFADGTDRIELENGVVTAYLKTGKREILPNIGEQFCEEAVAGGNWTKEVVE